MEFVPHMLAKLDSWPDAELIETIPRFFQIFDFSGVTVFQLLQIGGLFRLIFI